MFSLDIRLIQYFIRVLLLFVLYSLLRVLFLAFNWQHFEDLSLLDFIVGMRFDAVAIALWFLPFHVLTVIGLFWDNRLLQKGMEFFLILGIVVSILLTTLDLKYFEYTLKRTTGDVSNFFTGTAEIWSLIPQFLVDFWYLFFIAAISIFGVVRFFKSTYDINTKHFSKGHPLLNAGFGVLIVGLVVLMVRGGVQLVPLKIIDATQLTAPNNVPLVLNTPFTLIKTIGKSVLEPRDTYPKEALEAIFQPVRKLNSNRGKFKKKNVIVITLESFSNEFIQSADSSYLTPFFNSLKKQSLSFEHCYANGKKSIEGIPSIYSALPTLSEHPITTGTYGSNKIKSLAAYLKPKNYSTSFFHGGRNGTMSFDSYISASGFDDYYGLDEYPSQADFDGTWGIYDEAFFQFFVKKLNTFKQPFFSGFFSLSSHHPYSIPAQHTTRFNKSKLPMENSVAYADYALKTFFTSAKKQDWYNHTLFVITADHTPKSTSKYYSNAIGKYSIPLLFFCPGDSTLKGKSHRITQQTDILPSILDYLNYSESFFAFGQSVFDSTNSGFSVQYLNGIYQLEKDGFMLQHSGFDPIGLFELSTDKTLKKNLLNAQPSITKELETFLLAVLQQYNNRVIENRLTE